MIKLSIITPYHNEPENRIERMLESLSSQEGVDFNSIEIIVINNCEEPRKPKVISKHVFSNLNIRYILSKTKNYIGASRQTGVDNSKGEYLIFVDSDDTLSNNTSLKEMMSAIDNYPNFDLYCFEEEHEITVDGVSNWFLAEGKYVTPHAKIFKRSFLKSNRIKHLDNIKYSEDTLFNINCLINNPTVINIPVLVYKNHYNKDSTSNNKPFEFCWNATVYHCLGIEMLARKYKSKSTAVFNLLIDSLKDFKVRIGKYIDIDMPLLLTAVHIYNIIEDIDDNEVIDKDTLNNIKKFI